MSKCSSIRSQCTLEETCPCPKFEPSLPLVSQSRLPGPGADPPQARPGSHKNIRRISRSKCAKAPYSRRAEPASLCQVHAAPDAQDFAAQTEDRAARNGQNLNMSRKALLDRVLVRACACMYTSWICILHVATHALYTHGNHSIPCSC